MATITLKGNEIHTNGDLPAAGDQAPDFVLTTGELADVSLSSYDGKKKLLNIVPSLDTPVCQTSTKKFNDAAKENDNAVFLASQRQLMKKIAILLKREERDFDTSREPDEVAA